MVVVGVGIGFWLRCGRQGEALRKADDLLRQSVGAGGARHAIAIQNPEIGYDPPA